MNGKVCMQVFPNSTLYDDDKVTQLNLAANREGEGTATQTQFNGHGFANMRVTMRAVSDAQFDAWANSSQARSSALNALFIAAS